MKYRRISVVEMFAAISVGSRSIVRNLYCRATGRPLPPVQVIVLQKPATVMAGPPLLKSCCHQALEDPRRYRRTGSRTWTQQTTMMGGTLVVVNFNIHLGLSSQTWCTCRMRSTAIGRTPTSPARAGQWAPSGGGGSTDYGFVLALSRQWEFGRS
jgi:hypothetical protein